MSHKIFARQCSVELNNILLQIVRSDIAPTEFVLLYQPIEIQSDSTRNKLNGFTICVGWSTRASIGGVASTQYTLLHKTERLCFHSWVSLAQKFSGPNHAWQEEPLVSSLYNTSEAWYSTNELIFQLMWASCPAVQCSSCADQCSILYLIWYDMLYDLIRGMTQSKLSSSYPMRICVMPRDRDVQESKDVQSSTFFNSCSEFFSAGKGDAFHLPLSIVRIARLEVYDVAFNKDRRRCQRKQFWWRIRADVRLYGSGERWSGLLLKFQTSNLTFEIICLCWQLSAPWGDLKRNDVSCGNSLCVPPFPKLFSIFLSIKASKSLCIIRICCWVF